MECVCGMASTQRKEMVRCGNNSCQVSWYHRDCVGLSKIDFIDDTWLCPACSQDDDGPSKKEAGRQYCICNGLTTDDMVKCYNDTCHVEWYHYGCVNVNPGNTSDKWMCSDCSEPTPDKIKEMFASEGYSYKEENMANVVAEESEIIEESSNKLSSYMCIICLQTFPEKEELKSHLASHGDDAPVTSSNTRGRGRGRGGVRGRGRGGRKSTAGEGEENISPEELWRRLDEEDKDYAVKKRGRGRSTKVGGRGGRGTAAIVNDDSDYETSDDGEDDEDFTIEPRRYNSALPFKCNICARGFSNINSLTTHIQKHFKSELKPYSSRQPAIKRPRGMVSGRRGRGRPPGRSSTTPRDMGRQIEAVVEEDENGVQHFRCGLCRGLFDSIEILVAHVQKDHPVSPTKPPPQPTKQPEPPLQAVKSPDKPSGEGEELGEGEGVRQIDAVLEEDENGVQRYRCTLCDPDAGLYESIEDLVQHVTDNHPLLNDTDPQTNVTAADREEASEDVSKTQEVTSVNNNNSDKEIIDEDDGSSAAAVGDEVVLAEGEEKSGGGEGGEEEGMVAMTIDVDLSQLTEEEIQSIMQQALQAGASAVIDVSGNHYILQTVTDEEASNETQETPTTTLETPSTS